MAAATAARKPATKRAPARRHDDRNARALKRARTAPVAPRRKSGPVARPKAAPRPKTAPRPLARVAQGSAAVLVDRLLRGRAWVAIVGVLLAGIVFLNVSVLELNRGIAHTDAKAAALERTNSTLRERVASLDSAERIQELAEARGFVLPTPGQVTYLRPDRRVDGKLAAKRLESADPPTAAPDVATPTPTAPVAATTPEPTTAPEPATAPETTAPPSAAPAVPTATATP